MGKGRILVVDDDPDVLLAAELVLKQAFGDVTTLADPHGISEQFRHSPFDVVLLDMNFSRGVTSGREGMDWLEAIRERSPDTKVILMTAYGAVETAVQAIKRGASDFIVKPWDNEKLVATVGAMLDFSKAARTVRDLESRHKVLSAYTGGPRREIIGASAAMARVLAGIEKVARTDASVLILGENGTGKELVARAIHRASTRAEQPFVHVDLGAIPESLFESELFGHKKGAFTDAKEDRAGRFEIAAGGTLFLDEIGNLSLHAQAKLLGVLESRSVTRVGADTPVEVDVRIICATNMDEHELLDRLQFRQDLLYRINTVEIDVPPLRERTGDIALLIEHYVNVFTRKYGKQNVRVGEAALDAAERYGWPGNVRELVHAVERAVIMTEGALVQREDLVPARRIDGETQPPEFNLDTLEKRAIQQAIAKHGGNLSRAAQELGLGRTTLYRKMSKHGI